MSKKPGLDLASLDTTVACEKTIDYELKHPTTQEPLGVFIKIIGKDSNEFRDAAKRMLNLQLREQALSRKPKPRTADAIEAEGIEIDVKCTKGWYCTESQNSIEYKGEMLPFSEANARRLYTEQLWIRIQVDDAIGDLTLFIPAS